MDCYALAYMSKIYYRFYENQFSCKKFCVLGGSHAQIASDAEQQMVLLEKVLNLTPEQIDLLAPEQRLQVIQVQQAFRNRAV